MPERITGAIDRVVFHNPETGYAVLRVTASRRGAITVVGSIPSIYVGEFIEADGEWVQDRDHGLQFKATDLKAQPPHSREGLIRYLGSGLVKGIGPHFARRIVEVFGERTLAVIDESASFLSEVKGIGPKRIEQIRASWKKQQAVRGIMVFLQSFGVGPNRALRIYKMYGDRAIELIRENPYRLATDIWGIGFKTADELAAQLGIPHDAPHRARAALRFVLKERADDGHCGFPESAVLEQTAALTGIALDILGNAVESERESGEVVRDTLGDEPWLFLKIYYLSEVGIAAAIGALREGVHPLPKIDIEAALNWAGAKTGVQLAGDQREAVRRALRSKVLVITGGPGVGKTTIVRAIVEIFAAKKLRVALCAPTGRAAKRLSESTRREAKTIHRLLEYDGNLGGFKRDRDHPLDYDLIVVDECSMVDVVLMNQLLRAVSPWSCVVLVGDVDQLPSVGPGTVLNDIIASRAVPVARLTQIFRQAGESHIIRAAHAINAGDLPESAPPGSGDFYFVEAEQPPAIIDKVVAIVRDRVPAKYGLDPLDGVQVLTPMNRSELGVRNLNAVLQSVLNPPGPPEVNRFGTTYRVGDKVIQTENNYQREVFNGDIGRVIGVNDEDQQLLVSFDGRPVAYDFGELDEISLAYAITIHKSQGSEYPVVVIPLHTQHYLLLQRNLLYTGVTRGKKLVVIVGSKRALGQAVRQVDTSRRYSLLADRLRGLEQAARPNGG